MCSLSVTANGKVTATQQPISEAIQSTIDLIDWNKADKAVAATYNRYYLAVTLKALPQQTMQFCLRYASKKAWSGYDTGSAINVKEFISMDYQGKRRLFFLSNDGYVNLYDDELEVWVC